METSRARADALGVDQPQHLHDGRGRLLSVATARLSAWMRRVRASRSGCADCWVTMSFCRQCRIDRPAGRCSGSRALLHVLSRDARSLRAARGVRGQPIRRSRLAEHGGDADVAIVFWRQRAPHLPRRRPQPQGAASRTRAKCDHPHPGQGDAFLGVADAVGAPIDVIDDGSHYWPLTRASLHALYPRVSRSSGVYLVEDCTLAAPRSRHLASERVRRAPARHWMYGGQPAAALSQ